MIKRPYTTAHISAAAQHLASQAMPAIPISPPAQPAAHLHYGGSINPSGALGPKPLRGRTFRQQKRLETMVRLENAGIPESSIATMLSISVNRLRHIKKSTDYLEARMKITLGLIVDHEGSLAQIREQRREMLTQMLPPALQVIANAVQAPALTLAERAFQHRVATDILDREGSLAKVQRVEVGGQPTFDWSIHEKTSVQILAVAASGSNDLAGATKSGVSRAAAPASGQRIDAAASLGAGGEASRAEASSFAANFEDLTGISEAAQRVSATQSIIDAFRSGAALSAEGQQEALASLGGEAL